MIIIGKLSLRRFEQTEQPVTVRSLAGGQVFPCSPNTRISSDVSITAVPFASGSADSSPDRTFR